MNGFTHIEGTDLYRCDDCQAEVPRGIISISDHWAKCSGKYRMEFLNELANSNLTTEDKLKVLKKEFKVN